MTQTEDAWVWRGKYAPVDQPESAPAFDAQEFRFTWPQVYQVAAGLLAMLRTVEQQRPGVRLMTAVTGSDLRDHLEHFAMCFEASGSA